MPPAILSGTRLSSPLGGAENAARKEAGPSPDRTDSVIEQPASGGLFVPFNPPPTDPKPSTSRERKPGYTLTSTHTPAWIEPPKAQGFPPILVRTSAERR